MINERRRQCIFIENARQLRLAGELVFINRDATASGLPGGQWVAGCGIFRPGKSSSIDGSILVDKTTPT
jgi:hypothetical protein